MDEIYVPVMALWLPILLSAVLVFIASTVIHMAPLWHRGDYPQIPNEAAVREALRPLALPPGDYFIPRAANMQDMRTPEFVEKMKQGPVAVMTVMPNGMINMKRNLTQWFVFLLVVGLLVAYQSGHSLPVHTSHARVLRIVGVASFCCYVLALTELSIWYRRSWSLMARAALDGLIYAALTAVVFSWLWPRHL
jgi:hypothetical protein